MPPQAPKGGEKEPHPQQRGRSFALKGASLHIEERPSLYERNALFICTPAIPVNEVLPRYTRPMPPLTSFR